MFAYILLLLGYFVNKNDKRAKTKVNFDSFLVYNLMRLFI